VTLTADGAITNALGAGSVNVITSGELIATANAGIGVSATALRTTIGSVQATNATNGGIYLAETDGLNVVGSGIQTQAANGPIAVTVANGNLVAGAAVSANGSGNVLLQATGTSSSSSDVLVTANVSSGSGDLSIIGNRNVVLAGANSASVAGTGGTIDVGPRRGPSRRMPHS